MSLHGLFDVGVGLLELILSNMFKGHLFMLLGETRLDHQRLKVPARGLVYFVTNIP